jgi:ankyrin repeat protein
MPSIVTKVDIFIGGPDDTTELRRSAVDLINGEVASDFRNLKLNPFTWNSPGIAVPVTTLVETQERIHRECHPARCDLLVACFKHRLGQPFTSDGRQFPSISAYELLVAMEAGEKSGGVPEVLVLEPESPYTSPPPPAGTTTEEDWAEYRRSFEESSRQAQDLTRFLRTLGGRASINKYSDLQHARSLIKNLVIERLARLSRPVVDIKAVLPFPTFPFRGLSELDVADYEHNIFFGRDAEVAMVLERLRAGSQFLCLVGRSGTGKSSILKAGVLGALTDPKRTASLGRWLFLEFSPRTPATQQGPFDTFAEALVDRAKAYVGPRPGALDSMLDRLRPLFPGDDGFDSGAAVAELSENLERQLFDGFGSNGELVVAVNQLEEIFRWPAVDQRRFMQLLVTASRTPRVRVICTLRDDMQGRLNGFPEMRALLSEPDNKFVPISAPDGNQLYDMIAKPAERAGLSIEPPLIAKLLADAESREGNALPLVAFCLQSLRRGSSQLTRAAYDAMGGLDGALAKHIREQTTAAPEVELDRLFKRLVASHGGEPTAAAARRAIVTRDGVSEALVQRLIDARLLETIITTDGQPAVRLTHEILLRGWPALAAWIVREKHSLALLDEVASDAELWRQTKNRRFVKLRGAALDEVQKIHREDPYFFGAEAFVGDYIQAAVALRDRERLIIAINSGLLGDIHDCLRSGAVLQAEDRGNEVGQVRAEYWAAVTGDDRPDPVGPRKAPADENEPSIFDKGNLANATITRGFTVLHLAALCGHLRLVKRLVERHGVDPSCRSNSGSTALAAAAVGGRLDICHYLVETCHLDPAEPALDGTLPALWAQQKGHRAVLDYLISKGGGAPSAIAAGGWSRLTEAVRAGDVEAVRALVSQGASLDHRTEQDTTLLMIACQAGHEGMVSYLLSERGAAATERDKGGETALHHLQYGSILDEASRLRLTGQLVAHGLDINERDLWGRSALALASVLGNVDGVKALLGAGAGVDVADDEGQTPLFAAALQGHDQVVDLLLGNGADPNRETAAGHVALHAAADQGNAVILERIARVKEYVGDRSRNYNVDRPTRLGWTALMLAARRDHGAAVAALLKAKADRSVIVNVAQGEKRDALVFAIEVRGIDAARAMLAPEVVKEARDRGEEYPDAGHLGFAVWRSDLTMVRLLVDAGADPNGGELTSALHLAARRGSTDIAELLLERGSRPAVLDGAGQSPAEIANVEGHVDLAAVLARAAGDEPGSWKLPRISDELRWLAFRPLEDEARDWVQKRLLGQGDWLCISPSRRVFRVAPLPFYENGYLLAIEDPVRRGRREQFALIRPGRDLVPLDWTNGPIHRTNEHWGLKLSDASFIAYGRFFCSFVRGDRGRFLFVEDVDEIPWTAAATEVQKKALAARIERLRMLDPPNPGSVAMRGTCLYENTLWAITLVLYTTEQQVTEDGKQVTRGLGESHMPDGELVARDLPVWLDLKSPFC